MMKYLRKNATIVSLIAGFLGIILVLKAWQLPPFTSSIETTDNATIYANTIFVDAKIAGVIAPILIKDYDNVKQGETLLTLNTLQNGNYTILAATAGRLGEIKVKSGQFVEIGTHLLSIYTTPLWVIANYKETQIANMHIGQNVSVSVDALKGQKFQAKIDQIGSATTAEFSNIKVDVSSPNYIKVTKRVPVRIVFLPNQPNMDKLIAGMSVVTQIDTTSQ